MQIHPLTEPEFSRTFLDLFAFVECGDAFDRSNPQHAGWLAARLHAHCCRGARVYTAYHESGEALGFAILLIEPKLEGAAWSGLSAELLDIGLYPAQRGKGAGSELLRYVEQEAAQAGVYCLYARTTASDYAVIAFYGKNGYHPIATLPGIHGPGSAGDVFLRKLLR